MPPNRQLSKESKMPNQTQELANQMQAWNPRDYGRLETQVEGLLVEVSDLKKQVKEIHDMMQSAQGGWKMLMAVAGVVGAISGFGAWVASNLKWA